MLMHSLSDPPNDKQNLSDPRQEPGYCFLLCNPVPPNKEVLYTANLYKFPTQEGIIFLTNIRIFNCL